MSRRYSLLFVLGIVLAAGCGGGGEGDGGGDGGGSDAAVEPAAGSYTGVLVGPNGEEAVLAITISEAARYFSHALPVTGTARVNTPLGSTTITGTYDPHTMTLSLMIEALGLTLTGTFDGMRIRGSVTPGGHFDFLPTSGALVSAYCGSFGDTRRGTFTVLVASSVGLAGGAFVALDQGPALGGALYGTVSGSTVSLQTTGGGTATGTIAGDTLTGTWSQSGSSGTFTTHVAPCPRPASGVVTAVVVSANRTMIPSGESATLSATVTGTGTFSTAVDWTVTGGGTLSATTGASVTYTAPTVTASTTVTVTATSAADATKSGSVVLTIVPASMTPLGPLSTVTSNHAIRADGTLWAWGINTMGMLGTGDLMDRPTPVQIGTDTDWVSVVSGSFFRLALKRNGRVYAWGFAQDGELAGAGPQQGMVLQPTLIPELSGVISIGAGDFHGLAIKSDRTLWAWGSNWALQCGQAVAGSQRTPMQVPGLVDVLAATGGNSHTVVIARDAQVNGKVWTFGSNDRRELGVAGAGTATPQQIAVLANVTHVAAGYKVSAAIAGGTLVTWGDNDNFMIGSSNNPQTTPFNTGIAAASLVVTAYETLAVRPDGQLHGVGANLFGVLNGEPGTVRPQLVQVTSVAGARVVAGASDTTAYILGGDRALSWIGDDPLSVANPDQSTPQALLTNVRLPDDALP